MGVQNRWKELEQIYFLLYFGKLLPLSLSYLDWLVTQLLPIRKQSDFFDTSLIQFLIYAPDLDFEIKYLGESRSYFQS